PLDRLHDPLARVEAQLPAVLHRERRADAPQEHRVGLARHVHRLGEDRLATAAGRDVRLEPPAAEPDEQVAVIAEHGSEHAGARAVEAVAGPRRGERELDLDAEIEVDVAAELERHVGEAPAERRRRLWALLGGW